MEYREAVIDMCTEGGMSPYQTEIVVRCVEWMKDIINLNTNDLTGEPMYADSEKALEEARFILDCIKLYISI